MKVDRKKVYVANDGNEFETEDECRAYEKKSIGKPLVGLSGDDIEAARTLRNMDLAIEFERFGAEIGKSRRKGGHYLRTQPTEPRQSRQAPPPQQAAGGMR